MINWKRGMLLSLLLMVMSIVLPSTLVLSPTLGVSAQADPGLSVTRLEDLNGDGKINPYERLKFDGSSVVGEKYCFNKSIRPFPDFDYCETATMPPDGVFDGMTILNYTSIGAFGGIGGVFIAELAVDDVYYPAVIIRVSTPSFRFGIPSVSPGIPAIPPVERPHHHIFVVATSYITTDAAAGGVDVTVTVGGRDAGGCTTLSPGRCQVVSTLTDSELNSCSVILRANIVEVVDLGFIIGKAKLELTVCPPPPLP